MRCWLWVILLLCLPPAFAGDSKFGGYVMNAAAFRKIESYCVDTHNLPPEQASVVTNFVWQESKPRGLLTRLPWHRLPSCSEGRPDAIVQVEFPRRRPLGTTLVSGVLFVFRAGSPTPIYETRPLLVAEGPGSGPSPFELYWLERGTVADAARILIHDWQKFSAAPPAVLHRKEPVTASRRGFQSCCGSIARAN